MNRNQHVTAVITHRVRPGHESSYETWMKGISAAAREFEGYLGVSVLRPQPGEISDYVIVSQFDSCVHLNAWFHSDIRKDWIEKVQPLIQERESIQILTGLEAWFQLPRQPLPAPPKRYKQALLVWTGVMAVGLLVGPWLSPLLIDLPWILRIAINAAITVSLLTYVIMPRLTRVFMSWLVR